MAETVTRTYTGKDIPGLEGRTIIERGTLRAVTPPPVELQLDGRS